MTLTDQLNALRNTYALRRLNRRFPLQLRYTAPSGQQTPFTATAITFDYTSFDEDAGVWGVFFVTGEQEWQPGKFDRRVVPSYTLSN